MSMIRESAAALTASLHAAVERLSATQRLMLRGIGVAAGVVALSLAVGLSTPGLDASRDDVAYTGTAMRSAVRELRHSLDTTSGELELTRLRLERAEAVLKYSGTYQVPADLASLIYDTALREGIEPELAFRLINIESRFVVRARSSAGALGLAQVQPATARFYHPGITPEELFDPETNLRIGFRFLHDLIGVYGDTRLALLAYNRGPGRLRELLDRGQDPANGYANSIMEGYPGM